VGFTLNFALLFLKEFYSFADVFTPGTNFLGEETRACYCWCLCFKSSNLCSKRTSNEL